MDNTKNSVTATKAGWQGAFTAYGAAFKQIKVNPKPAVLIVAVFITLFVIDVILRGSAGQDSMVRLQDVNGLIFMLAMPVYGLAIADRKHINLSDFMRFNAKKYFCVLAAGILYGLIVAVSILPILIPLLWTVPWFALATYAVVDKNMGPINALKESKRLVLAHRGKVWSLIGVTVLLILLAVPVLLVAPAIGNVLLEFLGIVSVGSFAMLYRWLQHNVPAK